MKKLLLFLVGSIFIGCASTANTPYKDVDVVMKYFDTIGYDSTDKEFPILKEAVHHYFDDNQKEISLSDMNNAKAIVGFSFGQIEKGDDILPGGSNRGFAKIMVDLHKETKLPILAQWEIAEVIQEKYGISPEYAAYPIEGYLSTIGVIDQFEDEGLIKKGDVLVLVANYDHGFRVRKLLEKRGYKVLFGTNSYIPDGGWLNQGFDVDDEYGYFSESTQVWTKSRANFISEEIYWVVNELYENNIE